MIKLQVPSTLCLNRGFDVSVQGGASANSISSLNFVFSDTFSVLKVECRNVYSFNDSRGIRLSGEPTKIREHLSFIPGGLAISEFRKLRSISWTSLRSVIDFKARRDCLEINAHQLRDLVIDLGDWDMADGFLTSWKIF